MNFIKVFKKDLDLAARDYVTKKTSLSQIMTLGMIVFAYTHFVPIMRYYQYRNERIIKIENLKEEGKYVL
jgi:hypothetical protein